MLFSARSGRSATSAGGGAGSGLTRTPSLVLAVPTPAPATAGCLASAAPPTSTSPCASLTATTALQHPSHPLRSLAHGARGSAPSVVVARASPDGVAAAAAAAASASAAAPSPSSSTAQEERQQLLDYAIAGPLLASCGLSAESVRSGADEWVALGARLALQLGFSAPPSSSSSASSSSPISFASLDPVQRLRIYRYYLPVFFWVRSQLERHTNEHQAKSDGNDTASAAAPPPPPLVLGISAPQGCGKTTLTEQLTELFTFLGTRVAGVSIDDFYLTRKEQQQLADTNAGNRLLELRGNAGSHDLQLGARCLEALKSCRSPSESVSVPRYDKSAFGGKGDRAPESEWPVVSGPLQLVLFEGWMLGFRPNDSLSSSSSSSSPSSLLTADEQRDLTPVDAALRAYAPNWDSFVDSWLVVRVGDPRWVFAWRLQAEQAMRAKGKTGMSDEGVADFVSRYLPAYNAYLSDLYAKGPTTARAGRTLVVEVDEKRSPVAVQPPLPDGL